jgi:hypothetical protein
MTAIPRAEFRVFGHGIIGIVQARMWNGTTVLQQARMMPAETYVLSATSPGVNVKVRDGVLDIKTRVGDTPEGYQVFQPAAKFPFPMTADRWAAAAAFLGVSLAPPGDEATMPLEAFVKRAAAHPDLRLVTVTKERFGFTIGDAICEYARVWFNGALMESACVESERYESMAGVISGLGLAHLTNTNYIDAASRVIGFARAR